MSFEQAGPPESTDDDRASLLIALEAGGYVTEEQAARVTQRLKDAPAELPDTDSARTLLDWLIAEGYTTSEAEAKATQELLDGRFADVRAKLILMKLLEEIDPPRFEQRLTETVASIQREQKRKQALIGVGGLAVALAVGAYLLWPASTPACGASSTVKTLSSLIFDARMDMMRKNPMQMLDQGSTTFPRVSNHREVGYDEANRSRGCLADLSVADEHTTLGYVVRQDDKDKSTFVVQTFPSEYVTARYSAQGLNPKLGAPLGRDVIGTAFMAGVAQLGKSVSERSPSYGKPMPGDDEPTTLTSSVLGVMPAADCKQLDGDHVSCPLLIDYRDRLLGAIGAPSMLQLKGDFTFVKDGSGWKTADDFDKTLMQAIVARRVAKVYGDDVADKLDAQK
ncbi:hypothetical protein D1006_29685 [Burkholderia stabilis]|uniref:Uncharacterized protein n=1 Tax=Burkholderia stabilis TaxID=95485 RepID=A0A4Q2AIF9_9BURK|nr:hypothetical protein [Burkholderia stabilis]RXV69248.1 hypothetical protein D1006_29685 [Burkholderia stabilis]